MSSADDLMRTLRAARTALRKIKRNANEFSEARAIATKADKRATLAIITAERAAAANGLLTRCAASRDGECLHAQCPQLRDNEPALTFRHCPLDNDHDQD